MNSILYLLPLITAFTGWLFHKLMTAALLRRLVAAQPEIADKGGGIVATQLGDLSIITEKIKDPAVFDNVRPYIATHVDNFLQHKLQEKIPVISMFIGQGTLDKIKEGLMEEIDLLLPEVVGRYADNMIGSLDIAQLVSARVRAIPAVTWQQILRQALAKPMRQLVMLGAVSGFVSGLITLLVVILRGQ